MTKPLTPWEKQYKSIFRDIDSGKITLDNNFYLADFDGLILLIRGDLCPVSYHSAWMELQVVFWDYSKYGGRVPWEVLLKAATREERARLKESWEKF